MQNGRNVKCEYVCYQNQSKNSQYAQICFNNNNIYLLKLGCQPVAVVILYVYKI